MRVDPVFQDWGAEECADSVGSRLFWRGAVTSDMPKGDNSAEFGFLILKGYGEDSICDMLDHMKNMAPFGEVQRSVYSALFMDFCI